MLAQWQETADEAGHRWDIIDSSGLVVATVTDRAHAESYVDHYLCDERTGDE